MFSDHRGTLFLPRSATAAGNVFGPLDGRCNAAAVLPFPAYQRLGFKLAGGGWGVLLQIVPSSNLGKRLFKIKQSNSDGSIVLIVVVNDFLCDCFLDVKETYCVMTVSNVIYTDTTVSTILTSNWLKYALSVR